MEEWGWSRLKGWITFLSGMLCTGCGDNLTVPAGQPDASPAPRYEPWTLGAVWSYKLTDPSGSVVKLNARTTIVDVVDVGGVHAGKTAFRVRAEKLYGYKDVDEALEGDLDVRYASRFYDASGALYLTDVWQPYRLKLDESAAHLAVGAGWSESFVETETRISGASVTQMKANNWHVVSTSELVTVPAGTFTCVHINRISSSGNNQEYWYALDVGKVKETGGDQIEELMSFTPGL